MKKVVFFLGLLLSIQGYSQTIIASFEDQNDLQNTQITRGVDISRSTDNPAMGAYSCKIVFPENGGTFSLKNIKASYLESIENVKMNQIEILHFFIWTDEVAQISLFVEDSLKQVFTKQYSLKQGANHIQLKLSEAKGLDVKQLKSAGIRTEKKNVFYLDYVSFDQQQPVLDKLGRWDVEYSTDVKSPHYLWGTGFVNGPIKSYSISPVFDGRGIIELAERLDLNLKVTTIGRNSGAEKYGYGDFYRRRSIGYSSDSTTFNLVHNYIAEDLIYSPEFDVIIWPGMHRWESYPESVRSAILKRVKDGTGLVLLYPISDESNSSLWDVSPLKSIEAGNAQSKIKDAEISTMPDKFDKSVWVTTQSHYITKGVAFDAFPWGHMGVYPYQNISGEVLIKSSDGNPVLAVSNYGKGRVVALAYPERGFLPRVDSPWIDGLNYPYWEYMWSLMARSVVWASDREPETLIEEASRTSGGISIELNKSVEDMSVELKVIDDFGIIEEEITTVLSSGQTKADIKFSKKLVGGKHTVNIRLIGDEGVYDWYSLVFQTPNIAEIISVENKKSEIPVGENVQTSILLKSDELVNGALTSRLYDNYGRLVDEQVQEVSFKGEKSFETTLRSKDILTHLGKTDFILRINNNQTDHKSNEVFFLQPRLWDDYDVTMYHFGPNPVPGTWSAVDQQLQELNVTTLAAYTLENSKHGNYKVQAQTRIKGVESPDNGPDLEYYEEMLNKYLETHDKHLLIRKYGLKDSVYLNSVRDDLTTKIKEWKKFSPSAYYIYEEPSITRYDGALDLDFSEISLNAMREWLRGKYSSLKALNDQWGTNFTQWADVVPDDTYEARERGNYSSWADHRTFMEVCWADQFKFVQDIVNKKDPGGLVQLSGTQATSSHNGYDYSRLNQYVGQMNPYDIDNQLEYHLTFNPDLKVSGQAGYGALGKGVIYDYYHHLFLKETGGSYVFWQVSSMNPDLQICQAGRDMKEGFDEMLKRGIGRLISSYKPENELKIAIHYSYPSIHAAWIVDGEIIRKTGDNESNTLRQYNRNRDGWVKVLHDMGVGFNFIAYSNIEQGGLLANGYKVLILPMSYALSNKEVEQIEKFVEQGGILIADALPGVMDDHTKFRSKRALADVFGIKSRTYTREELVTPDGESGLKVKKADVLLNEDNKSELLYNKYGKGLAFLLNYFMDKYSEEKINHTNETSLQKLRGLFEKENLKSEIVFTKLSGGPANSIEKYSFSEKSGSTRLLGLLPGKTGEDREIKLHVNEVVHLYDIRNKRYLGDGNEFKIKVKNSVPELFGLVRGKIDDITVETPSSANRGEKITINYEINGKGISDLKSVARVDVFRPDGEYVNYYSKNCDIINAKGSYSFQTALNDIPGEWKVQLTEVISGAEKVVLIRVE